MVHSAYCDAAVMCVQHVEQDREAIVGSSWMSGACSWGLRCNAWAAQVWITWYGRGSHDCSGKPIRQRQVSGTRCFCLRLSLPRLWNQILLDFISLVDVVVTLVCNWPSLSPHFDHLSISFSARPPLIYFTRLCRTHRSVLNILDSLLANQIPAKGMVTIVCRIEIRKMAEC